MSPRAFRSLFPRSSRVLPLLSLAVVAVAWASPGWTAATPAASPPPAVRPTLIVSMAPTSAPAAVTPPATPAVSPTPAAPSPAAVPAAPAPVTLVPVPGPAASAPAPAPTVDVGTITQPFVGTITGDKVYLRSGPDTKYYEIGQLYKGDLVYVVGVNKGWYQVLPPNGAFCMVAREFVDLDTGGAAATIKGDPVNVRAGSAIYKDADPYAVLPPPLRKGTRVKVLGSTDKFYQIAPPEKAYFFVNAQYVKAAPGTEYKVAQLKLPAGVAGPSGITVVAPTTIPAFAAVLPEAGLPALPAPGAGAATGTGAAGGTPGLVLPPRVAYSETALAKFNEAKSKYEAEIKKPVAEQNFEPLLQNFKDILALDNISPIVKSGSQAYLTAIDHNLTVQRLTREQTASAQQTKTQIDDLRAQQLAAQQALDAARAAGPYTAQGLLQTSTIVAGKYALVNPQTQRVVAYVDPSSASIDVGMLVGKYIAVRGVSKKMDGSDINVIQVSNATMMPQPQ
jgi:uncharacterized protein YgiM (DUF1202 family)